MTTLPMTEADMEYAIRAAVEAIGGYVFSVRDSRGLAVEHMPDLVVVCGDMVAFLELKSQRRKVTPGQQHVLEMLAGCTRLVSGVVRPIPKEGEMSYDDALALIFEQAKRP